VAVRLRFGDDLAPDREDATRPVIDNDLLTECFAQPCGDESRDDIRRGAGRDRHDPANGACRIRLRVRDRRSTPGSKGESEE
jgi:hypothetical protein